MGFARYVGRVGALAVALGVASAVGNVGPVAFADTDADSGSSAQSVSESPADTTGAAPEISNATTDSAPADADSERDDGDQHSGMQLESSGGALTSSVVTERQDIEGQTQEEVPAEADTIDAAVDATDANSVAVADAESMPTPSDSDVTEAPVIVDNSLGQTNVHEVEPTSEDDADTTRLSQFTALTSEPTAADLPESESGNVAMSLMAPTIDEQSLGAPLFSGPLTPLNLVVGLVASVLNFGIGPLVTNGPGTPVPSPALWVVLAFVRHQLEHPFSVPTSGCACASGITLFQWGSASCSAEGFGSFALALGDNSVATATGAFNIAAGVGNNSQMGAYAGNFNTALHYGDDGNSFARGGHHNTATAWGYSSQAVAEIGNRNTATAFGYFTGAFSGTGDRNTAVAIGTSTASAQSGDGNLAIIIGDDSSASAGEGDGNTAIGIGRTVGALALQGDHNTAIVYGVASSASAIAGENNVAIVVNGDLSHGTAGGNGTSNNTAVVIGPGLSATADAGNETVIVPPAA